MSLTMGAGAGAEAGGGRGGGDDADSFELGRIHDLYVAGELTIPSATIDIPDIFANESAAIDDTPEAAAAFSEFVDQLDSLPSSSAEPSMASAASVSQTTSAASVSVSVSQPMSSTTCQSNTSGSGVGTQFGMASTPTGAQDYPDRLDLRTLTQHAFPLNLSLPSEANIHIATANAPPYSSLFSDVDALSTHLPLPLPTRSWVTSPNMGPGPGANSTAQFANIPRAHDMLMTRVGASAGGDSSSGAGGQQMAATRGRPRVKDMRHVPERHCGVSGIVGSAGGVPVGTTNSPQSTGSAKLRYSKGAAPSKYCHVCGRSAKTVSVALCGNNRLGLCRKVVCDKCLLMHQRDSWDMAKREDAGWICMHCRNQCPERARCHQYQRNNLKRRMRTTTSASGNAANTPFASSLQNRQPANGRIFKHSRNNNRHSAPALALAPTSATASAQVLTSAVQQTPTASAVLGTTYASASATTFRVQDMIPLRLDGVPGRNVSDVQMAPVAQMGGHFLQSFPDALSGNNDGPLAVSTGALSVNTGDQAFGNANVKVECEQLQEAARGAADSNPLTKGEAESGSMIQAVKEEAQHMLGEPGAGVLNEVNQSSEDMNASSSRVSGTKPDDDVHNDAPQEAANNVEKKVMGSSEK